MPIGNQSRGLWQAPKFPNGPLQLLVRHGPIVGSVLFAVLGEPEGGRQMMEGGLKEQCGAMLGIVWIDPNAHGSQPQFVIGE